MHIFLMALLVGFLAMPAQSIAQGHSLYCGDADSTAATQTCLKRHLDAAQSRLNKAYKKLSLQLESEKRGELEELQQTWLAYRDAECMWEVENTQNPGLKRINELSCMARLSDDRADILSILNDDKMTIEGAREYGSFPRWMNALANVDGGIYWNYGGRKGVDLNCDGEDEFIMSGVETRAVDIKPAPSENLEEGAEAPVPPVLFEKMAVVAVTQNPSVGKPTPTIFKFEISNEEGDDKICNENISLVTDVADVSAPIAGVDEENADTPKEESCMSKLEIKADGCDGVKTIIWSGKDFILAPDPEPTSEEEGDDKSDS